MLTLMIVRRISSNVVYASMGNHVFAAIGLRLHECVVDGTAIFKFSTSHKECEFVYFTDPSDWVAIPWIATRFADHGIVMQQCGDALPLMRHTLRQAEHTLTDVDIQQCTEIIKLAPKDTIKGNFLELAKHFCGTDDGHSPAVLEEVELYEKAINAVDDTDEQLLADPLLEAVYDDLDDEDKGEFKDIGDKKKEKKYRARVRLFQVATSSRLDATEAKSQSCSKSRSSAYGCSACRGFCSRDDGSASCAGSSDARTASLC